MDIDTPAGIMASTQKIDDEKAMPSDEIIQRYKKAGKIEDKTKIIEEYAPLVNHVVGKMMIFLPQHIEEDDLLSDGLMGLMDAVDKFKPDVGVKFSTYATTRIRGSIIDGLRQKDWVPRSVRKMAKDIENAQRDFEIKNKKPPTTDELSKQLNISTDKLFEHMNNIQLSETISIDDVQKYSENMEISLSQNLADPNADVELQIEKKLNAEILSEAIKELPQREQLILSLYYYEDLSVKEIQAVLNISAARISQIHIKTLGKLKQILKEKKNTLLY